MTIELVVMVAIIGCVLGFLLARLTNSGKKSPKDFISVHKPKSVPADVEQRVEALVDDGHKIGALKELRDATGLELKEAKKVVDSLAAAEPPVHNADKIGEVRDLVREGKADEALELYRQSSGLTFKQAKEVVDKMVKEFG